MNPGHRRGLKKLKVVLAEDGFVPAATQSLPTFLSHDFPSFLPSKMPFSLPITPDFHLKFAFDTDAKDITLIEAPETLAYTFEKETIHSTTYWSWTWGDDPENEENTGFKVWIKFNADDDDDFWETEEPHFRISFYSKDDEWLGAIGGTWEDGVFDPDDESHNFWEIQNTLPLKLITG